MRLAALGLENFKAFYGEHKITLPVGGRKQTVHLFGGLNGAGKTTLAQAMVLALHGEHAAGLPGMFRSGRDARKHYQAWLRAAFNQDARTTGKDQMCAWVRLVDGSSTLTVTRWWWFDAGGDLNEEQLEVREEAGKRTTLLESDEAHDLVEAVLPRRLLDFAMFDGERVRLLDDTLSAAAVRGALDRLLNLDAVERTRSELQRLIRERRTQHANEEERSRYEMHERRLQAALVDRSETLSTLRDLEVEQDRIQRELDQLADSLDAAFASSASPSQLSADLSALRDRRTVTRTRLGRHLGDWLYLWSAFDSIPVVLDEVATQRTRRNGRDRLKLELETLDTTAEQIGDDESLRGKVTQKSLNAIREWLKDIAASRRAQLDDATVSAESGGLSQFSDSELADIEAAAAMVTSRDLADVGELAGDLLRVNERIRELEQLLAQADGDSATSQLLRRRDELNVLSGEHRSRMEQLRAALDDQDTKIASLRTQVARAQQRLTVTSEDRAWLTTAEKTVAALQDFLAEVRADASQAVRDRMLRNLRVLLRKDDLVTDVSIDPISHVTRLIGPSGTDVELPSAAEHQLAAMAFIDAVLAAADNPIPVFVDTPLARLDSHHRRAVVGEFWPSLGRQVIVLSTDEEVVDELYALAGPSVAATYRVECGSDGRSRVTAGKYVEGAHRDR